MANVMLTAMQKIGMNDLAQFGDSIGVLPVSDFYTEKKFHRLPDFYTD